MSKLIVTGGGRLSGRIRVHGSKNAALPILAATLLIEEPVRLLNCPRLSDVENMLEILRYLGCSAAFEGEELVVNAKEARRFTLPEGLSKELRSSIFLLGPVLGRFKEAAAPYPGGCDIGIRPIDLHLKGLKLLNASVEEREGLIHCRGEKLKGNVIHLDYPSVGATENILMAACAAEGETRIINGAREPEIDDLMDFLNQAGFCVRREGVSTITVAGGRKGRSLSYRIMPDRIVAGTYLTAAAITGGALLVEEAQSARLTALTEKLREAGAFIREEDGGMYIEGPERPKELRRVDTMPYPGFPTDMQSQIFALCTLSEGSSVLAENVFENRFRHAGELKRMGAICDILGRTAVVRGVRELHGAVVTARDLRCGAALTLAGLRAKGDTVIEQAELIDRGYVRLEEALNSLGASIKRED